MIQEFRKALIHDFLPKAKKLKKITFLSPSIRYGFGPMPIHIKPLIESSNEAARNIKFVRYQTNLFPDEAPIYITRYHRTLNCDVWVEVPDSDASKLYDECLTPDQTVFDQLVADEQ